MTSAPREFQGYQFFCIKRCCVHIYIYIYIVTLTLQTCVYCNFQTSNNQHITFLVFTESNNMMYSSRVQYSGILYYSFIHLRKETC